MRLGHADINTTLQIYTHATEKMAERSVEVFEKGCQSLTTSQKALSNRSQMGFRGRPESPQTLILCALILLRFSQLAVAGNMSTATALSSL